MIAISLDALRSDSRTRPVAASVGIAAVLALVTIWLYAPVRGFDFVNWDAKLEDGPAADL